MAGHNKWSKVKHRKAVVDKRRSKAWTKVARAIIVAARHAGPDPSFNVSLRYAIDEARYHNMPRDVIDRAIKKGAGGEDTSAYEPVRYEGYAPGGVAIIIDALTDNRTRTVGDIRQAFAKFGGNLGSSGCVAYLFDHRGQITLPAKGATEERLMEVAIEAGASDIESPGNDPEGFWTVLTDPTRFQSVKDSLEKAALEVAEAQLGMVPQNTIEVRGEAAKSIIDLVDALEELDDVQKVYTNADIPDDVLAAMS